MALEPATFSPVGNDNNIDTCSAPHHECINHHESDVSPNDVVDCPDLFWEVSQSFQHGGFKLRNALRQFPAVRCELFQVSELCRVRRQNIICASVDIHQLTAYQAYPI